MRAPPRTTRPPGRVVPPSWILSFSIFIISRLEKDKLGASNGWTGPAVTRVSGPGRFDHYMGLRSLPRP
jgi:hypothetical protein